MDDQTLTFGVSGMLWNRSLVMYDRETDSKWSHILGEAMDGPLKGKTLTQIPSTMTDWQTWTKEHPESTVAALSRTSQEYRREFYRQPERFVLGFVDGDVVKAWTFEALSQKRVIQDQVGQRPVLAVFHDESATGRLYDRKLADRVLTFRWQNDQLIDQETNSTWNLVTGTAVAGPSRGAQLAALPAIVSYTHVWERFHPQSKIVGAEKD